MAREFAVEASSSRLEIVERSTTEGADTAVGTTTNAPNTEFGGSRKLNPVAC